MFNNQSITPVETEEKQFSVKGTENDSQEHSESSRRPAALEPVTKLSVSNLTKSQVAEPDSIRVTDNGTSTSAKVNRHCPPSLQKVDAKSKTTIKHERECSPSYSRPVYLTGTGYG